MAMKLRPSHPVGEDLASLAEHVHAVTAPGSDATGVPITGVTLRSQDSGTGDLFAALPGGSAHGAGYARDAVGRGAVAVLTDPAGVEVLGGDVGVPVVTHPSPRAVLGELAATVYGHPSR